MHQSWSDYLLRASVNWLTVVGYLLTGIVFWAWSGGPSKAEANVSRVVLRAGLVAIAFAPGLFMDPGGLISVLPASLASVGTAVEYALSPGPFGGVLIYYSVASMIIVWGIAAGIGVLRLKSR